MNQKITPHDNLIKLYKIYKWEYQVRGRRAWIVRRYLMELAGQDLAEFLRESKDYVPEKEVKKLLL